ncbi:STAS domain-containing protein [Flavisolibacter tropicus]|uniref:Anti-sigma-factor antagonist n=1 Tax=Flavisolibacter tropicus TaxID=1492898 RepID=A0A172U0G8_9BACT|nr:STAS domain-containing protein [Flavisolibacter tropicus]ANE52851.1 anti-sigma-factor antagonist [Flavisolibacter tropicus]
MEVKTDTKERFHVISVESEHLSANMTEDLCKQLATYLQQDIKNVVLKLNSVNTMDEAGAEHLVKTQQQFYDAGASFVICELTANMEQFLDQKNLLELMNTTPTESEAWDIVQMEEIERELLGDEDEE